jgi:predicted acylesterase/phospholipase RssA
MNTLQRRTICSGAAAAVLAATFVMPSVLPLAAARAQSARHGTHTRDTKMPVLPPPPAATSAQPRQLPPRTPFTAAEDDTATIPGMPDARFWADSEADFNKALPTQPGPWLILSTGGSDGAFGAGFLSGLSASGQRPDYAVVTGVSTGALMAPFAFAGPRYDSVLRAAYTQITAADIFEVGSTGESFVDSWPLKDLIAKEVTPALLADVASAYAGGRRLFVITTELDAQRSVVWNMGAIAAHGGDGALKLFRSVMLASGSIPGAFPPVEIDVESNGKHFQEMHVDGGVGGQFFVAPAALMESTSDYRIPATQLYVVVNSGLGKSFQVVERSAPAILTQAVGAAVTVDLRLMLDRTYIAAKRSGIGFNVASIPLDFSAPSRGAFDPDYMKVLFQVGYDQGKSANPFGTKPPPYPGQPATQSNDTEKTGANR